jgi:hypothetical protein
MNLELHILTECYIDTLLVKTLAPPTKRYNHQKSCSNVLKTMREEFAHKVAFGVIDDDKKITRFDDFLLMKEHNKQLTIHKHKDKPHYVVKIGKAVEDFILTNAQKCNVELSEYDLPSDLENLRKITKRISSLKEAEIKVRKVFLKLRQDENSDFYKLAQWIEDFKTNPYNLNIE